MRSGREKRSRTTLAVKPGSARWGLAALVVVVGAALLGAWIWMRAPAPAGSTGPHGSSDPAPAVRADANPAASAEPVVRTSAPRERDAKPKDDPDRFRGRGRIRGEVVPDGLAMPQRWTLVLEPHPTLVGAEHAERRRVAYENGETRFDCPDLPLGGYRVYAEAAALNSTRVPALLARGSSDVHVTLRLAPAGLVDGFVFDHAGRPAEGLRVTLESRRTRERAVAEVDAAGTFVLRDVVDGEYQIFFGAPERPFVPPGDLVFKAPTLRWPETRLPPTGAAAVTVRDARGAHILDAEIVGSGTPQGVVRGRTGADGVLLERFLWPARYEIRASSPDGRSGRTTVEVTADARVANATIVVE